MIREATESDCKNLVALSLLVWLETYAVEGINKECSDFALSTFTVKYFSGLINNPNYRILVCMDKGCIQGYALVNLYSHYKAAENGFEIEKLYVHNKFKGQGIGRRLLLNIEKKYGKNFWLYTWVENESNGFYRKLGFKHIGQFEFKFAGRLLDNNVFSFKAD